MLSSHFWMFVKEELALVQAAENTTEAWPGIVFGHTDDLRRSLFRQIGKDVSSSKKWCRRLQRLQALRFWFTRID